MTNEDDRNIENQIRSECSNMCDFYAKTGRFIYRGIRDRSTATPVYKIPIRTDRKPVFTNEDSHDLLNTLFNIAGVNVTRTNSLFCTTSIEDAHEWGKVAYIFVPNEFEYLWFNNTKDKYAWFFLRDMLAKIRELFDVEDVIDFEHRLNREQKQAIQDYVIKTFKEQGMQLNKGLEQIGRNQEVLIKAPYYYALPCDNKQSIEMVSYMTNSYHRDHGINTKRDRNES